MPVQVGGLTYFTNNEVLEELGITRQALWRWREKGRVPAGVRRQRTRQVLFTTEEVAAIREYANRLEPIEFGGARQLALFGRGRSEEGA
jgi:predicted DNA-binding transcriptional regulator AlpA